MTGVVAKGAVVGLLMGMCGAAPGGAAQEVPREFPLEGGLVLTLWDRWDHIWSEEELRGAGEEIVFGATARSRSGRVLAELQVERYANPAVTQPMMRSLDESSLAVVDSALWLVVQSDAVTYAVVHWGGARVETHNGVYQAVAPYVRQSVVNGAVTQHHLIRIFNGENSYDLTVSFPYDERVFAVAMQERLLRDVMRNLELRTDAPRGPPGDSRSLQ